MEYMIIYDIALLSSTAHVYQQHLHIKKVISGAIFCICMVLNAYNCIALHVHEAVCLNSQNKTQEYSILTFNLSIPRIR